jgi:hypothetical protein
MKSLKTFIDEGTQEKKLKKAHDVWRKDIEKVFRKRMKETGNNSVTGSLGGMSDGEILRILDNIGW